MATRLHEWLHWWAYNTHWSADLVPPWLHVFDDGVLSAAVRQAGFVVEWTRMFSRTGLPDFCRLDGRENLGLVARKPGKEWEDEPQTNPHT